LQRGDIDVLGGVFISYRRDDSGGFAGRIYDRLTIKLGRESVFFDVDNIAPGLNFFDVLSERVAKCDALVAVIGRNWISSANKDNRRRLDDPNDFVRIEIEAALERGVRVIPVLVDGATMPNPDDLPESLKKLARRQGIEISLTRFDSDVERLTRALALLEEEIRQRQAAEAERSARDARPPRPRKRRSAPDKLLKPKRRVSRLRRNNAVASMSAARRSEKNDGVGRATSPPRRFRWTLARTRSYFEQFASWTWTSLSGPLIVPRHGFLENRHFLAKRRFPCFPQSRWRRQRSSRRRGNEQENFSWPDFA
jgi:hypothetical protein